MKIGVAGPVSLRLLGHHFPGKELPEGYVFPPMAYWIEELITRGHQVVVFTYAPRVPQSLTYSSERLTVHVVPQRATGRARDFFAQERRGLLKAMQADRCEIIHAHWTYEFALAALDSGIPTLVTAHDEPWLVLGLARDAYRMMRLLMAYRVSKCAQFMTAVSSDTAMHFKRFLGHAGPISVIPNCIPRSVLAFAPKNFFRDPSEIVFASVLVGFGRTKNAVPALQAFAKVRKQLGNSRFIMFGRDYELHGPAHQWAMRTGLDQGVEFIGALSHDELLGRLSQDVDVLVHPSRHEALSTAVMESLALGLSVIAGATTPGMKYLLEDGRLGKLTDVTSPDNIAGSMLDVARNKDLRLQLAISGRTSVLSRFSADVVIPQFERIYEEILDKTA
jgi:L-malate glycosyltransferase